VSLLGSAGLASAAPEGTMTWGVHITLAARWLESFAYSGPLEDVRLRLQ
jgi:hypothetical protein